MRRLIGAMAIAAAALAAPVRAGDVQCECPSVDADGTGNTSCSATETGGSCTIDFNTFDLADEAAAFDLLSEVAFGDPEYRQYGFEAGVPFGSAEADRLGREDPAALVDLLLIYALVSTVQTEGARPDLGGLHDRLRNNAAEVADAFTGFAARPVVVEADYTMLVAEGCAEIRGSGYWAMFKAFWSPLAPQPRCGGAPW